MPDRTSRKTAAKLLWQTPGVVDPAVVRGKSFAPERVTVLNRGEKSAEAIVAARRRAEREGGRKDVSLGRERH